MSHQLACDPNPFCRVYPRVLQAGSSPRPYRSSRGRAQVGAIEGLESRHLLSLAVGNIGGPLPSDVARAAPPYSAQAATYVVSTTGRDSDGGTSAAPFLTVNKAMSVAQPGEVILVRNGTYHEIVTPVRSGTPDKPITVMGESTAGVVFDGTGLPDVITPNSRSCITLQNLTVRYAANGPQNYQAAVCTGDNWTLQDMVVEKVDGTGICVGGRNVTLTRVISRDNGVAGIGGTYANTVLIKDCMVRRNNNGLANPAWQGNPHAQQINGLWYMDPDYEAGGGKWWASSHITIDGMWANSNTGPGIWFDWNSSDVRIRNSRIYRNHGLPGDQNAYQGDGIRVELQKDGPWVIEGNRVRDNSGAGITLLQDRNVVICGNTLLNNDILFRDYFHDANHAMQNITIVGNLLKNARFETWEGTWTTTSGANKQIIINSNIYDNGGGVLMSWAGTNYNTLDAIRSTLGFEINGQLITVTMPQ